MTFNRTGKPHYTRWGVVQHADELAPGIWAVSTASHGGIVLSLERFRVMPEDWRTTRCSANGEYEEDCDWALPYVVFHRELDAAQLPAAMRTIEAWHPLKMKEARARTSVTA